MSMAAPRPVGTPAWVELTAHEPDVARDFYGGVFGWDFTAAQPYAVARKDGEAVAGIAAQPAGADAPPGWSVYLAVADVEEAAAQIRTAGGEVLSGPVDRPGARTALARDPGGASFGVWQAGSRPGATVVGEPATMCGHELLTRAFVASKAFYETVFGYGSSDLSDQVWTYCSLEIDGVTVAGIGELAAEVPREIPAHWMTYFACSDADATTERAAELGATVLNEPSEAGFGRLAVLQGPVGEVFTVVTLTSQ